MKQLLKMLLWVVFMAPLIYLMNIWNELPERVPLHFDINGNADRYGSKTELAAIVGIMVVVSILTTLLIRNIHRIDPKKKYTADSLKKMKELSVIMAAFLSALAAAIIYSASNGTTLSTGKFIFIGVGLLFAILGNYMYNIKPNYFIGIRIATTLEDENNWKATHRLAAPLWLAGGVLIVLLALVLPLKPALYGMGIVFLLIIIVPIAYSIYLYKTGK